MIKTLKWDKGSNEKNDISGLTRLSAVSIDWTTASPLDIPPVGQAMRKATAPLAMPAPAAANSRQSPDAKHRGADDADARDDPSVWHDALIRTPLEMSIMSEVRTIGLDLAKNVFRCKGLMKRERLCFASS